MLIFALIIVISVVLYIYFKVAILRSHDRLTQEYYQAKSRICLGSFIVAFGINQYLLYETRLTLFIGIAFLLLGFIQLHVGIRDARFFRKEYRRLNP
ncbi:MAG TPA: YtpI family protein [Bacillota bacterium]|nr:YtpI family protein [Bacillota bacterium]